MAYGRREFEMTLRGRHINKLEVRLASLWPLGERAGSSKPYHMATATVNEIYSDLLIAGVEEAVERGGGAARLDDVTVCIDLRYNKIHNLLIRHGEWDAIIQKYDEDWIMIDGADGAKVHGPSWQDCIRFYYSSWAT